MLRIISATSIGKVVSVATAQPMPHSSTSPQTSDLRTPPIACSKSFLSNSREHDSIFNQKGDEVSWILSLSISVLNLSNRIKFFRKSQGLPSRIDSRSSSNSKIIRN